MSVVIGEEMRQNVGGVEEFVTERIKLLYKTFLNNAVFIKEIKQLNKTSF